MSKIELSKKFKEIMKEKNINQQELARRLNITQPSLSSKLQRNNYTLKEIEKISSALGYNVEVNLSKAPLLTLMHWNINQKHYESTPMLVIAEIIKANADIVVLTEFYKTANYSEFVETLEAYGYKTFVDKRKRKEYIRQVFIAVKKECLELNSDPELLDDNDGDIWGDVPDKANPNYMSVDLVIKNREGNTFPLTVIGTRIRTKKSSGYDERHFRNCQLNNLLNEIKKMKNKNLVLLGDFNICKEKYIKNEWNYKDFEHKFEELGFCIITPLEGFSPFGTNYKQDHLIIPKNLSASVKYYDSNWEKGNNVPDHSILLCDLYSL